jgi:hypothetical protein
LRNKRPLIATIRRAGERMELAALCQHLAMKDSEQRQAKILAISHGVILGAVLAGGAVALTFLATVALDLRSVTTALLIPAVEVVAIITASVVYMYKRRGF